MIINESILTFAMKIVLTTTFLAVVLSIGLFGMNNVFAQGNDTMSIGNDTSKPMNATLAMSIIGSCISN